METLLYIYRLYTGSELLTVSSILNVWLLYFAVINNYRDHSRLMMWLKIWAITFFFIYTNIFVFMPYIGSLKSGIMWEVLVGLNVVILIYISKREDWTFEDVKDKDRKKVLAFLTIYVGANLYWIWLLYEGAQMWIYYAFP